MRSFLSTGYSLNTTAKDRVRARYPQATARRFTNPGEFFILQDPVCTIANGKVLGRGTNAPAAWDDAAFKLPR